MVRVRKSEKTAIRIDPPALTLEDREDQLIALAVDLAEQRLRDGTASNQLIAEIMKMGTTKEKLQKEKLERENAMLKAKTEAIEAQKHTDDIYRKALDAMRSYAGISYFGDEDYEDDSEL